MKKSQHEILSFPILPTPKQTPSALPTLFPSLSRTPLPFENKFLISTKELLFIIGIIFSSLIIIFLLISIVVFKCKQDNSKIYADKDSPSGSDAGNARILAVYSLETRSPI